MSDQSKGHFEVYEWVEGFFHPRLKQRELPNINDGVDSKVICFCAGFIACLAIVLLSRFAEQIKFFISNF